MIVRKFMQWAATAASAERAEGAGSLARAYLYADWIRRTVARPKLP